MTYPTRKRLFTVGIAASLIFWLLETGYFGWNMSPQSHAERVCDQIASAMFISTWLLFFMPGLSLLRAINPFRRVTWLYIERERDGREVVTTHRVTRLANAILLAGAIWLLHKLIRSNGAPSRLSRFLIVTRIVENKGRADHA